MSISLENAKILLVEDELHLGEAIFMALEKMGLQTEWVKTLKLAKESIVRFTPDAIVLDWNLPDGEGIELLKNGLCKNSSVLILSSKSGVGDRVKGLRLGADDYLPKPFSFDELEARLMALLRRHRRSHTARRETGALNDQSSWGLNDELLQVTCPEGVFELTPLEYKFLKYLVERENTIISKDRLLKDVWGFSLLPKTRTVDYVLTNLRRRLEPDPEKPVHLLTVRGAGVKFLR